MPRAEPPGCRIDGSETDLATAAIFCKPETLGKPETVGGPAKHSDMHASDMSCAVAK